MRKLESVLVTGGCGFMGSAFIRYLLGRPAPPRSVLNLDALTYAGHPDNVGDASRDPRYRFVRGDIADGELVRELCREHEVDAIVHFAAETHVDRSILGPRAFVQTNVVGTVELLEVLRELPHIHLHHVSTDEVFGSLGPAGRFGEQSPYRPSSPYAASKAASDHFVRAYATTYGISITVSSSGNNYGPYQHPEKLVPLMLLRMLEGQPLPIYGDGSNVRDWLYVDDHAEAVWLILTRGRSGESYNIGGGGEQSNLALLAQLIEAVAELSDRDAKALERLIRFVPDRPGHDQRYALDAGKLAAELGWSRRHDLGRGLRATVRWYLDSPAWIARVRDGAYPAWLEQSDALGRG